MRDDANDHEGELRRLRILRERAEGFLIGFTIALTITDTLMAVLWHWWFIVPAGVGLGALVCFWRGW